MNESLSFKEGFLWTVAIVIVSCSIVFAVGRMDTPVDSYTCYKYRIWIPGTRALYLTNNYTGDLGYIDFTDSLGIHHEVHGGADIETRETCQ